MSYPDIYSWYLSRRMICSALCSKIAQYDNRPITVKHDYQLNTKVSQTTLTRIYILRYNNGRTEISILYHLSLSNNAQSQFSQAHKYKKKIGGAAWWYVKHWAYAYCMQMWKKKWKYKKTTLSYLRNKRINYGPAI